MNSTDYQSLLVTSSPTFAAGCIDLNPDGRKQCSEENVESHDGCKDISQNVGKDKPFVS